METLEHKPIENVFLWWLLSWIPFLNLYWWWRLLKVVAGHKQTITKEGKGLEHKEIEGHLFLFGLTVFALFIGMISSFLITLTTIMSIPINIVGGFFALLLMFYIYWKASTIIAWHKEDIIIKEKAIGLTHKKSTEVVYMFALPALADLIPMVGAVLGLINFIPGIVYGGAIPLKSAFSAILHLGLFYGAGLIMGTVLKGYWLWKATKVFLGHREVLKVAK